LPRIISPDSSIISAGTGQNDDNDTSGITTGTNDDDFSSTSITGLPTGIGQDSETQGGTSVAKLLLGNKEGALDLTDFEVDFNIS